MKLRTWHAEIAVVASVLAAIAVWRGSWVEWICAAAVVASFGHAQVAERMREREAARAVPDVHCWRWLWGYFVAKEVLWVAFFTATGAYAALGGCAVFLAYPAWRKWWRRRHPLALAAVSYPEAPSDVELVRPVPGEWHLFHPTNEHLAVCEDCQKTHRELMAKHLGVEID